jgi:hypothetical protein
VLLSWLATASTLPPPPTPLRCAIAAATLSPLPRYQEGGDVEPQKFIKGKI